MVCAWWLRRLVPYNLIVFGLGVPSFLGYFYFCAHSGELDPGEDVIEPLMLVFAAIAAPILVNVSFLGFGLVGELALRYVFRIKDRRTGPWLMRLGLLFSIIVVLCPSVFWWIVWLNSPHRT